jgi:hypothetical protein
MGRDLPVQETSRSRRSSRSLSSFVVFIALSLGVGCEETSGFGSNSAAPALLHSTMTGTALGVAQGKWAHYPVPPEDGPELAPTALVVPVLEAPVPNSELVGYLRLGERVARSVEPVSSSGCPGGWYAIRPLGFVCQGHNSTLRMDSPLVRAFPHGPDRSKPLPYRYGFIRAVAPNYLRVPSKEEQFKYEMRLERHLRNYEKLAKQWDVMEFGANDVPLSPSGAATGPVPPEREVPNLNVRYGGEGDESTPWWLVGERRIPNIASFAAPGYAVIAGRIKRHAGLALIDSFVASEGAMGRRFAVSVDGRLVPSDKIKAEGASKFHGEELSEVSLPVAFPWREGAREWKSVGRGLESGEALPLRKLIALSGKVQSISGVRHVETKGGIWLRSNDLKVAPLPSALPWFAKNGVRWIDISILSQTLVLYEGSRPVYATLISSGRDGLGDPSKTRSTPTGTFRIYQKHVTTTMDSDAADDEFELRDVPWVMYFKGGYALHAAYWHDDFGRSRSHGCVNLSPIDARYIFNWTTPDTPPDWHASYAGEAFGKGTLVHIHG